MKFASNMNCCVPQCTAYHRRNPELSFHSFPTCDKRRKEWIRLLRVGKKLGKHYKVCSRHFKSHNYRNPNKQGENMTHFKA